MRVHYMGYIIICGMELLIEKASKIQIIVICWIFLTPFLFFSQNQILSANIGTILDFIEVNVVINPN